MEHTASTAGGLPARQPASGRSSRGSPAAGTGRRRRTQDILRQARTHFGNLLDGTTDAVFMKDPAGRYVFVNKAAAGFLGRTVDEIIGRDDTQLFSPETAQAIQEADRRVLAHGETSTFEEIGTVGEVTRIFLSTKGVFRDESGRVLGLFGIARDITRRKEIEQHAARLAAIVESSDDAILTKTPDGKILTWNAGAVRMFGYSVEEIVGRNTSLLLPPEKLGEERPMMERIARGERVQHHETVRLHKDGRRIDVSLSLSPMYDEQGRVTTVSSIARDVTERKRTEAILARQTEELQRSNAELERFAYVASHDLQEPLRMITSYVQLLARRYQGKLDSDADEFIAYVVDGAARMRRLIQDLLTYSRIRTRGLEVAAVDLTAVLAQVLEDLKIAIGESGATVTHGPLPTVVADRLQMEQLFQNLIGNALKFRSDSPPRVRIEAERQGPEWVLAVRDNGIGMEPRFFERVFVVFQRLHGRNDYPGTGIGLAICQKIIERHGGRIWIESSPGAGSTFFFTLPGD